MRHCQQPTHAAELAFDVPASRSGRLFFGEAGLAETIFEGGVAELMEANLAVNTMEERVKLFEVGTETGSACSFEYALVVLATALALLALDVVLELLLVGDELVLAGVH